MTDPRTRWNDRYRDVDAAAPAVSVAPFLVSVAAHLPTAGRALDIGGGLGRNARWLAARGLETTLLDVSDVGLAHARAGAGPDLTFLQRDVEADGLPPDLLWDAALMHLFFVPEVVLSIPDHLSPGGVMLVCQPTVVNLERHERPARRFLLAEGQIAEIADALVGVEVLEASAEWRESGRHDAWLVARKLPSPRCGREQQPTAT